MSLAEFTYFSKELIINKLNTFNIMFVIKERKSVGSP